MPRFKLVAGKHNVGDPLSSEGRTQYIKNDVLESDEDLEKKWREKFVRVPDETPLVTGGKRVVVADKTTPVPKGNELIPSGTGGDEHYTPTGVEARQAIAESQAAAGQHVDQPPTAPGPKPVDAPAEPAAKKPGGKKPSLGADVTESVEGAEKAGLQVFKKGAAYSVVHHGKTDVINRQPLKKGDLAEFVKRHSK